MKVERYLTEHCIILCLIMITVIPVILAEVQKIPVPSAGVSASTVVQVVAPPRTAGAPGTVTVTGTRA